MIPFSSFGGAARQALQGWSEAFARPQFSAQHSNCQQGRRHVDSAALVLSGRGVGQFHFETILVTGRSDPDQEFAETSTHWRLDLDNSQLRLRRWRNHASLIGAYQVGELDARGAASDPLPDALAEWLPSLLAALASAEALNQAGARDMSMPASAEQRAAPAVAPPDPAAKRTDWRGIGLFALLVMVATPMKIGVGISDGLRSLWQRLRQ